MTVAFAGATHPGRKYGHNEDAIGWSPEKGLFLVADGMGGHASGEVASGIVRDTLLAQDEQASLAESVHRAHEAIIEATQRDPALASMGSTVIAARIDGSDCELAWVGDSRAYLFRRGRLMLLTRDHSLLELIREREDLTEEELRNHPNRNVVTQTLGLADPIASVEHVELEPGDRLLLCSDGLNDELTDEEIAEVLNAHADLEEAAQSLIGRALDKGGRDNVSVVLIEPEVERRGLIDALRARWRRLFG